LKEFAVIVHGGAGDWPKEKRPMGLKGVRSAATVGFKVLKNGESAIAAVEAAVVEMENNPVFNAGTGATLNMAGYVEADAGIMDGATGRGAGVALLRHVKNPVRLARKILDSTDHALLAGSSAERLSAVFGLDRGNLRTPERVRQWKQARRYFRNRVIDGFSRNRKLISQTGTGWLGDTVGALAIDSEGNVAAADSTGGVFMKLPGRIGDSPILGAGLYADNNLGAATATGLGEIAMRLVVSKMACDAMSSVAAQRAASWTVREVTRRAGRGQGIITLDLQGRYGVAHNTRNLCWAAFTKEKGLVSDIHR